MFVTIVRQTRVSLLVHVQKLILLLTPLLGKTPIVFYGQNTAVGFLPHATGRFDPYVLCNSSFIISYYVNKVIQRILLHLTLKVIS